MSGINKVIIVGNLGNNPNITKTKEDKEIASLSIATSEVWKDKITQEKREKTEWHKIVIFQQGLVKIAKEYLKKGSKVYLEGQLSTRKYISKDGIEKYTTEIILNGFNSSLILLDRKENDSVPVNDENNFPDIQSDTINDIPF